jgi:diguanylate cyclase (GGDEF)-like protein
VGTVLIIDDSEGHRGQIRRALELSAAVDRVLEAADGIQGLKLLLAEPVDVVVCDLEMPGLDGDKLLRMKAQSPGGANIPFLFVTANTDLARRARLFEQGACDAIAKPFHPAELVARLELHLRIKRLEDELREKNARLAQLSTTDSLTGLRSRRFAFEILGYEFQRARRYGSPLCVLMADLDHFKAINDAYGHPAGDAVLQGVASLLLDGLRAADMGGRYGGGEILVVLQQRAQEGGLVLAERWRAAVEQTTFEVPDGRKVGVTVSIGIAEHAGGDEGPSDLVARADAALYRAKQGGRNRIELG